MGEALYLTAIAVAGDASYRVTLTRADGEPRDYEFVVASGPIDAISAPPAFSDDVGSFGHSELVYKAVSDFHAARQQPLGRPDWARGGGGT